MCVCRGLISLIYLFDVAGVVFGVSVMICILCFESVLCHFFGVSITVLHVIAVFIRHETSNLWVPVACFT